MQADLELRFFERKNDYNAQEDGLKPALRIQPCERFVGVLATPASSAMRHRYMLA